MSHILKIQVINPVSGNLILKIMPRKLSIVHMKVLKQLVQLILISSLLVQARRPSRADLQFINKIKQKKLFCECGQTIIKDGKKHWIQRLMGLNKTVDGKRLRCGYSINDMHSTDLVTVFKNRKYKRKCISQTGFCYSMEMKRKDGTHTSKIIWSMSDIVILVCLVFCFCW